MTAPFVPLDVPDETDEQAAYLAVVAGLVPATAQQVGAALGKMSQHLQKLTDMLGVADEDATKLTEKYDLALDLAYLREVAADDRIGMQSVARAKARVETAALRMDMEAAKLAVRKFSKAHSTLDRRIDVGRTNASTIRSEHRNLGYGGAP